MTSRTFRDLEERVRLTVLRLEGVFTPHEDQTLANKLREAFDSFRADFAKQKSPIELAQEHADVRELLSPGDKKTYDRVMKTLQN